MNFDHLETHSSQEQRRVELEAAEIYSRYIEEETKPIFDLNAHVKFVSKGLVSLPAGFVALESSQPWLLFWMLHSLALLKAPPPSSLTAAKVLEFLRSSQHARGGLGGAPGQIGHLANTYAGVAAAVEWGSDAITCLDRRAILAFLCARCVPLEDGGGLEVCEGGERDVRGCYTALAVAHMLHLDKRRLAERAGIVNYIKSCQTYEGGIGAEPGTEAHGGYTYCGLAALMLIGRADALDLPKLLHFVSRCQGSVEGGFMGRTNKLVDGCYSFWQGGLFPLLQQLGPELLRQTGIPHPVRSQEGGQRKSGDPEAPSSQTNDIDTEPSHAQQPMIIPSLPAAPALSLHQQAEDCYYAALDAKEDICKSNIEDEGNKVSQAYEVLQNAEALRETIENRAEILIERLCPGSSPECDDDPGLGDLFNADGLALWILACCQAPGGGLRDKPGTLPDFYHTCYCLSGLSLVQHYSRARLAKAGGFDLEKTDPLCNVSCRKLEECISLLDGDELWLE